MHELVVPALPQPRRQRPHKRQQLARPRVEIEAADLDVRSGGRESGEVGEEGSVVCGVGRGGEEGGGGGGSGGAVGEDAGCG